MSNTENNMKFFGIVVLFIFFVLIYALRSSVTEEEKLQNRIKQMENNITYHEKQLNKAKIGLQILQNKNSEEIEI